MYKKAGPTGIAATLLLMGAASVAADEPRIAWDESVNGDLSNDFAAPSSITISEPGEYIVRAETGPMTPVRREGGAPAAPNRARGGVFTQNDKNGDGRIDADEATGNFGIHFAKYDINGDGAIELQEMGQFRMGGDGHDTFDFVQAPGINLVAIKVTKFDDGGPKNEATVLALIDHDDAGETFEAAAVELTEDPHMTEPWAESDIIAGIVTVNPDGGTEIYAEYDLWKTYRRNDETVFWRIGEGQEKATTEFVFVFE